MGRHSLCQAGCDLGIFDEGADGLRRCKNQGHIDVLALVGIVGCVEPNAHYRETIISRFRAPVSVDELVAVTSIES